MLASVLITGDADGLRYVDRKMTEAPRSALNFCCSCSEPEYEQNFTGPVAKPLKRLPFQWTPAIIQKHSQVDHMKRRDDGWNSNKQHSNSPMYYS